MPHFILHCLDHPGALDRRMAVRPQHLDYIKTHAAMVRVAGPLLDAEGGFIGSCFILEAEDAAAVDAFVADDPYTKANLFATVRIDAFKPLVGSWPG
jgi:uncharacterized protein